MRNPLFTRLPFHKTVNSVLRPEQLAKRYQTPEAFSAATLTPAYRLPEFIIEREITLNRVFTLTLKKVDDNSSTSVTFTQDTDLFYHQSSEKLYIAFNGQDITPLDCGLYYYLVVFENESEAYYSQYFKAVDIASGTIPIGYCKFEMASDCRIGNIAHDKWTGFTHELWIKSDDIRPVVTATQFSDENEFAEAENYASRIDRTVSIPATLSLPEADMINLMYLYIFHTVNYFPGRDQVGVTEPYKVLNVAINEAPDYTVGEEDPHVSFDIQLDEGMFSSECCNVDAGCADYTVSPTYNQSSNTIQATLPSADFPSGYWAVIQYKRDDASEFSESSEFTEAVITGPGGSVDLIPFPPDTFEIRVVVKNFSDCIYYSEITEFSV